MYTLNNYTPQELEYVATWSDRATTHYCAKEKAPTTGTPHLQGYITFRKPVRHSALCKMCERARFRVAKGDRVMNFKYLFVKKKKGDTGEPYIKHHTQQGKRSDVDKLKVAIQVGGVKRAWDEATNEMMRMHRGATLYQEHLIQSGKLKLPQERSFTKYIYWVYGPSRFGKTEFFQRFYRDENVFVYDPDEKDHSKSHDFTGYSGQPVLILDDVRPGHFPLHSLRKYLSRSKRCLLPRKCIEGILSSAVVVICTNLIGPFEYEACVEKPEQIYGRVDYTIRITKPYNP